MITDLIYRQNPGLIGFLRGCQDGVYLLEKTSKKEPVRCDGDLITKLITKWHNVYLNGCDHKQRTTNIPYIGAQPKLRKKIGRKKVSISRRVRRRDATKKSIEFKKYSSLFL